MKIFQMLSLVIGNLVVYTLWMEVDNQSPRVNLRAGLTYKQSKIMLKHLAIKPTPNTLCPLLVFDQFTKKNIPKPKNFVPKKLIFKTSVDQNRYKTWICTFIAIPFVRWWGQKKQSVFELSDNFLTHNVCKFGENLHI
jgi:hypothetical protein